MNVYFVGIKFIGTIRPINKSICFQFTGWGKISPGGPTKIFCQKLSKSAIYVLIKQLQNIIFVFQWSFCLFLWFFFAVKIIMITNATVFPPFMISLASKILSLKIFGWVIEKTLTWLVRHKQTYFWWALFIYPILSKKGW